MSDTRKLSERLASWGHKEWCGGHDVGEVRDDIKALEAQLAQVTAERDRLQQGFVDLHVEYAEKQREAARARMDAGDRKWDYIREAEQAARREALREALALVIPDGNPENARRAIQALIDAEGGDT